ncbi:NUDIX domain-containing protein [Streptomyces sp. NPDC056682]|uniref:NUDIX domain-containing protein n=1 Tax=Streptomyces sp. NPDC056682 TaxID=3345909 RepID=UPI00369F41B5
MVTKFSVECWIRDTARGVLLLQVPARIGEHGAFWQPVTGGIEPGETPLEAVLRELHEETGLRATEHEPQEVARDIKAEIPPDLIVSKTLYTVTTHNLDVVTNPDEHQAHQWLPAAEVSDALLWDSNRETWALVQKHLAMGRAEGE